MVALAAAGAESGAQDLARRVAAVGTGTVRFEFPSDPDVCGNGSGNISIRREDRRTLSTGSVRSREWEEDCEPGPVRISLTVRAGEVDRLRAYVGGRWRGAADRDLGAVPASDAMRYLLDLVDAADERVAKEAIFPAIIAEGPEPYDRLLRVAKDDRRAREVRSSAVFWVGQGAADAATKGLQEIVDDPSGDREVRKSAVFALSQQPRDQSVPALIRIARSNRDPEMRRTAIFWLGQSRDPRAIAYFEEVLTGR